MNHKNSQTQATQAATNTSMGHFGVDVAEAFDDFMQAFEAFKSANDARLKQIERRVSADPLTTDKVERINEALDEQKRLLDALTLKARRPGLGIGERRQSALALEHKIAFNDYIRRGDEQGIHAFEKKAKVASVGTNTQGGYLVPDELSHEISRRMATISPLRAIASVQQVSGSVFKKTFTEKGPHVGWVAETDARPETDAPALNEVSYPTRELYAMPAATATLLDDAAVNVEEWIAEEVEMAFAEQESIAFINGTGTTKPSGLLSAPKVAQASWAWGSLGFLSTGSANGFGTSADVLVDLVYSLKAGYRQNAHWLMSRETQGEVRKIKDSQGYYIWQPAATADGTPTLMNFPIAEAEHMPAIANDSYSIAFGDFRRGYLIVDRLGVRVLRDPYSKKPYVLFYTSKRVGGGVADYDAIKLLKFGT